MDRLLCAYAHAIDVRGALHCIPYDTAHISNAASPAGRRTCRDVFSENIAPLRISTSVGAVGISEMAIPA